MYDNFSILDADGKAIPINKLDADACRLWDKTSLLKEYANPSPDFVNKENLEGRDLFVAKFKHVSSQSINWFDSVGFAITCINKTKIDWVDVVNQLMAERVMDHLLQVEGTKISLPRLIDEDTDGGKKLSVTTASRILCIIMYYQPYVELINFWSEKGYKPSRF